MTSQPAEVSSPEISTRHLEYLVAAVRHETWAEGAASLGVTPSAMSQGIAELERRLGLPLFERRGRRRVLDARAAPVVEYADRVLAATADLARWTERRRSGGVGRLRVGLIDVAAVDYFPAAIRSFRADHPELELHLRVAPTSSLLEGLNTGELDVAIMVEPVTPRTDVAYDLVMTEELAVYGPPEVGDLAPQEWGPWLTFPAGSHTRRMILRSLGDLGASTEVVAESHQPDVLRSMVELGMGWTVLPTVQAESGDRPLTRQGYGALFKRRLVAARRADALDDPDRDRLIASIRAAAD